VLKSEISREFEDFPMPTTLDAAQLCGIKAIVRCAMNYAASPIRTLNTHSHGLSDWTKVLRSGEERGNIKQPI
jgi:hypothetical protein